MMQGFNIPEEKNYFLVPAMPTPNGRIHLGHIGGPYLKMDVIRRKVRRGGGLAFLAGGTDAYESYVERKAEQLNISTADVCNRFHDLIVKDFEALDIQFDRFINPLDAKWNSRYMERERELVQMLTDAGAVLERKETFPYDTAQQRYLNGCWIEGDCPNCGSPTGSYLCEICGTHYRPSDLFSKERYPAAELIEAEALYLKIDPEKVLARLREMNLNKDFINIFTTYIALQGAYIRLTTPQQTGVSWEWGDAKVQMIFTYTGLLLYSIFCADICQEEFGLSSHPFAAADGFVTIAGFGIDNSIAYLAGSMAGGMGLPAFKGFDYFLPNYFLHLNGQKFSTSRLHVIWGNDIVNQANVQPDAIRYYLIKQNADAAVKDFEVSDFVDTVNKDLFGRYNSIVGNALSWLSLERTYETEHACCAALEELIKEQNAALNPSQFDLAAVIDPIWKWADLYESWNVQERTDNCYWWLKGLSLLAYPVMPRLSGALWSTLSPEKEISLSAFFSSKRAQAQPPTELLFREVTHAALQSCLPEPSEESCNSITHIK